MKFIEVNLEDGSRQAINVDHIHAVWEDAVNDRIVIHSAAGTVVVPELYDDFGARLHNLVNDLGDPPPLQAPPVEPPAGHTGTPAKPTPSKK